ncbi:MAG: hypothetical protein H7839_06230 [Magnetococcus sp. YQC-5]
MDEYSTNHTPVTAKNAQIFSAAILASVFLYHHSEHPQNLHKSYYETNTISPSCNGILSYTSVRSPENSDNPFEKVVADFYKQLIENEESIGKDFAHILHDNIWDLYEG